MRQPRMEGDCWQLVVTRPVTPNLLAALARLHLEIFPMPPMEDDLPTYGITFTRSTERPCPHCKGDGADPDDEGEWFPEVQMHNPNMRAPCPVCHGTGTNPAV